MTCDFITDLPVSSGYDSLMVIVNHRSTKGVISIPCHKMIDMKLHDEIIDATSDDEFFAKAVEALKTKGPTPIRSKLEDWRMDKNILFFKDRCYVPPNISLRHEITRRYHDSLTGGHPGHLKTLELIHRNY